MAVKLPDYVVREVFNRVVPGANDVRNSNTFIMRGRCPICQDHKERMFIKDYGDDFMVYCHNCSYSRSFIGMLNDHFSHEISYLKEFTLDSIADGSAFKPKTKPRNMSNLSKFKYDELDVKLRNYALSNGFPITQAQDDVTNEKFRIKCIKYFKGRKVPIEFIKSLNCFIKGPLTGYCGIPFYSADNKLLHWQGRRMWTPVKGSTDETHNPKYKFLKDTEHGIEIDNKPFYGLLTVNKVQDVHITEGAVDSLFFDNGVATSGASISDTLIRLVKAEFPYRVWAPDNIWVDKAGMELAEKLLKLRESVFVFPPDVKEKDANNYILKNDLNTIPKDFIKQNTYTGMQGLLTLKTMAMKKGIKWIVKKERNGKFQKSSKGNYSNQSQK